MSISSCSTGYIVRAQWRTTPGRASALSAARLGSRAGRGVVASGHVDVHPPPSMRSSPCAVSLVVSKKQDRDASRLVSAVGHDREGDTELDATGDVGDVVDGERCSALCPDRDWRREADLFGSVVEAHAEDGDPEQLRNEVRDK